ncbi:MAG: hypothetical protein G01um101438_643 [Parcubacteria group bacterium Gr01-1014_38]|nr:MAG: hypothetical protein G01um101438_643 [Parcubacteria group bacterium Gr01-1014_38]
MSTVTLSPISHELLRAWKLFSSRWRTAVLVGLSPVIVLAIALPILFAWARNTGSGTTPSLFLTMVGIAVLIVFYLATIPARAGLLNLFARHEGKFSAREALRIGLRRFWPFFGTELLIVIPIGLSLLPLLAFQGWFAGAARPALLASAGITVTNTLGLLGVLLLASLPMALSVAVSFSPITAAVGDTSGGLSALKRSFALLRERKAFWKISGRLALWVVLFVVICTAVEPLPFVQWMMPFVMSLIGAAFLVTLYKELTIAA